MGQQLVVLFALFCLLAMLPVALFFLTYIFRISCRLCGLPMPGVFVSAFKLFVSWVMLAIVVGILREMVRAICESAGVPQWEGNIGTWLLALPVDLVISSSIQAGLMQVHFGKAVEVWFVQRLIQLGIVAVIVFIVALVLVVQMLNG